MNYSIETLPHFDKQLKRLSKKYKSLKEDFGKFVDMLRENPAVGADLGNGVRKVRMAISTKGKGKSHGARVITFAYKIEEEDGTLVLLFLYDKEERSTITKEEIAALVAQVQQRFIK